MAKNRRRNKAQATGQGTGSTGTTTATQERPTAPTTKAQPVSSWIMCPGRGCISPVYTSRYAGFCDKNCMKRNLDLV